MAPGCYPGSFGSRGSNPLSIDISLLFGRFEIWSATSGDPWLDVTGYLDHGVGCRDEGRLIGMIR